jgi:Tfp pilus assembly protein PilV
MIATAILAVAILAVVTVIINSISLERSSKELNIAKNAAELQMQQLRGLPFGAVPQSLLDMIDTQGDGNVFQGNFNVVGLRVQPGDADQQCGWFELRKRAGAVNENLIDITVRIDWAPAQGRAQQFMLVSMRSDRGTRWVDPGG